MKIREMHTLGTGPGPQSSLPEWWLSLLSRMAVSEPHTRTCTRVASPVKGLLWKAGLLPRLIGAELSGSHQHCPAATVNPLQFFLDDSS